ncbi:MAG: CrcB family protein [Cyanobacteria bacterium LVE1205-1]|jgi:CrcB protein
MLIKILDDPVVKNSIAISLGAIVGSLSRYFLTLWFTQRFGVTFPYGTFFINLTGTLGIGFCSGLFLHHVSLPPNWDYSFLLGF